MIGYMDAILEPNVSCAEQGRMPLASRHETPSWTRLVHVSWNAAIVRGQQSNEHRVFVERLDTSAGEVFYSRRATKERRVREALGHVWHFAGAKRRSAPDQRGGALGLANLVWLDLRLWHHRDRLHRRRSFW